jgi:ABC-type nitrate/sulfonate/bicarbonate transport system substrate-binding protein
MNRRRLRALLGAAVLGGAVVLAVGCGGGDDEGGDEGTPGIIRFAFAPDPVWDYLKDEGILEEMEAESGIEIVQLQTDDEFGIFAGGHADIVSTGSYETPLFDEKGIPTMTIGRYNASKDLLVASNPDYQTASDLPKGCKIGSESTTGNTLIWAALIKSLDNRELAANSDDLELAISDTQIQPDLVADGELCASIADPTQATEALRTGKVFPMYDGKSAAQLFAEDRAPGHFGVNTNNFVARKAWYDANPEEVAFFLEVWEEGLRLWHKDPNAIIDAQPQGFSINSPEDGEFMKDYIANVFDFFQPTVYLTPEWVEAEEGVFDITKEAGSFEEDTVFPAHAIIDPKTGETTEVIGGD